MSSPMVTNTLASRLEAVLGSRYCSADLADRVAYSRDVSPLLLQMAAHGGIPPLPAVIVWPENAWQLGQIMHIAIEYGVAVTLYGGGSGIVGGAVAPDGIICDMKRFDQIGPVDEQSLTVEVGAGVVGRVLEDHLNALGYSSGHEPQSNNSATVGGWIAHRGAGFASTRYGKIEDRLLAVEAVLPNGEVVSTRVYNRAATGPDLKQLFLGGEGMLGAVTRATLAVHPIPPVRSWEAVQFESFAAGARFLRELLQREVRPAIVRLYDEMEARFLLEPVGLKGGESLLIIRLDGERELVEAEMSVLKRLVREHSTTLLGPAIGEKWWPIRFNTPYLVNPIRHGGIADSLDVGVNWAELPALYETMLARMREAVGPDGEVFGHLGHAYQNSTDLYMIFRSSRTDAPAEVVYGQVLEAAFSAADEHGATLSHHHGIGSVRAPFMDRFTGGPGIRVLRTLKRTLDPHNILNPGKLLTARIESNGDDL